MLVFYLFLFNKFNIPYQRKSLKIHTMIMSAEESWGGRQFETIICDVTFFLWPAKQLNREGINKQIQNILKNILSLYLIIM